MPEASEHYQFFNLPGALEYLVDVQGVIGMLPLLRTSLARDVPEVSAFLANGDTAQAAARLHSLKGYLPIFCYPALVDELLHIEKCCKAGLSSDLLTGYEALASQLQGLAEELLQYETRRGTELR